MNIEIWTIGHLDQGNIYVASGYKFVTVKYFVLQRLVFLNASISRISVRKVIYSEKQ